MTDGMDWSTRWAQRLHRHLLALVVLGYALAAAAPGPGLWLRDAVVGPRAWGISPPKLLLAFLLFNAGLRARPGRLGPLARRPGVVLAGLAANAAVPIAFLAAMVPALRAWHNPDEAAVVLLGLALVASMPIAGSSTGWALAADGDVALSLALVLGSTLLSPLTTPATLHALGAIAPGAFGAELHRLAGRDTGSFLAAWVLLPSGLGLAARVALGESRAGVVEGPMRVAAPATLPALGYLNASSCLPGVVGHPDWDFLGIALTFVAGLCALTFGAGYGLGRALGLDRARRASLTFGLGMNNNGTGLVLASVALAGRPLAILPILLYNLAQHLAAAVVDVLLREPPAAPVAAAATAAAVAAARPRG